MGSSFPLPPGECRSGRRRPPPQCSALSPNCSTRRSSWADATGIRVCSDSGPASPGLPVAGKRSGGTRKRSLPAPSPEGARCCSRGRGRCSRGGEGGTLGMSPPLTKIVSLLRCPRGPFSERIPPGGKRRGSWAPPFCALGEERPKGPPGRTTLLASPCGWPWAPEPLVEVQIPRPRDLERQGLAVSRLG